MTTRTTQTIVRFYKPFSLPGIDARLQAGEYLVDRDEERIDTPSHSAWLHTRTFIHLPAISVREPVHQMVPIDLIALETALQQDRTP